MRGYIESAIIALPCHQAVLFLLEDISYLCCLVFPSALLRDEMAPGLDCYSLKTSHSFWLSYHCSQHHISCYKKGEDDINKCSKAS